MTWGPTAVHLLISSSFESQRAILTMSSAEAAPGNLAVLPLESRFVAGVAEIKLTITFDPSVLSIEDVMTAVLTRSFSLTADFSGKDSVDISLISPVGINSNQDSVVQFLFKVNADADTGKSTMVNIKRASLRSEVSEAIMVGEMNSGQISITGRSLDVTQQISSLPPRDFELSQNYPNPFNSQTRIRYGLLDQKPSYEVSIRIYNLLGQLTRKDWSIKSNFPAIIRFNGMERMISATTFLPGFIYGYLKAGEVSRIQKILVLKYGHLP